jgi:probable F420-dependent oxidoreductase
MSTFGITTFPTDYAISPIELAKAVEERGFDSLFFNEHTHIPVSRRTSFPGGGELPQQYCHTYDPFVALAAAAAVTTRLRLGTGICLIVERDPIILAKEIASLDRLSNGRVIVGIGAGWNAEEMENHGTAFALRWKVLRERVLAMRRIWTEDAGEFHGEFVNFDPIWSWPKPVQKGGPKILLGSRGRRCLERVTEYCDGWMPLGSAGALAELARGLGQLRELCASRGRRFESLEVAAIGLDIEKQLALDLLAAGFHHLVFSLPPLDFKSALLSLDSYAGFVRSLGAWH